MIEQGMYNDFDVTAYHADPCPAPSLSSGLLRLLLETSPAHAYCAHPRLGGGNDNAPSRASQIGSVAHRLVLLRGAEVAVITGFRNYQTKAAQEAKAAALAAGKLPILESDYADAERLSVPLTNAVEAYMSAPVRDCMREVAIFWQDAGGWRRALADIISPDKRIACDLKTVTGSAHPDVCSKRIYAEGMHIQRAHYVNGLNAVDPANERHRRFGFIFGEQDAPHAVSPPLELSEAGAMMAQAEWSRGSRLWDACLKADKWPAYDQAPLIAEPPSWSLREWEMRNTGGGDAPDIQHTGWEAMR